MTAGGAAPEGLGDLTTPLVADACLRLKIPLRFAPQGLRPLIAGTKIAGRVLPARHSGSVDVFLEALGGARPGDVLVIDNAGRPDEGCIGDLVALEARQSGLAGLVVWGCHRDTAELLEIALPVFSYGAIGAGPRRLDPAPPDALTAARFGTFEAGREDVVAADDDGALFVPAPRWEQVIGAAREIAGRERRQAERLRAGESLRAQLRFAEYLEERARRPQHTFREHLRSTGGAVEE